MIFNIIFSIDQVDIESFNIIFSINQAELNRYLKYVNLLVNLRYVRIL